MPTPFRVALLGFTAFERNTLGSYFRLAATRQPRYEQVQLLPEADFIVADADHPPSVQLVSVLERVADCVFIGAQGPEGAAHLARPLDPLHVMRELDAMVARKTPEQLPLEASAQRVRTVIQAMRQRRSSAAVPGSDTVAAPLASPVAPPVQPPAPRVEALAPRAEAAPARRETPAPRAERAAPEVPLAAAAALPAAASASRPSAPAQPKPASRALLVDDSEVALRFLQTRLAPFGLQIDCAESSQHAQEFLARGAYDFVFLDVDLGESSELDGLSLCQQVKRRAARAGTVAATVVLVTAHYNELDRVRGTLAGCDGFLGKPLDEVELARLLARHGLKPVARLDPAAP